MRRFISLSLVTLAMMLLPACGGDDRSNGYSADDIPADVDPANFDKVQLGMSRAQVEELIGEAYTYNEQDIGTVGLWTKPDGTKFTVFFNENQAAQTINAPPPGLEY